MTDSSATIVLLVKKELKPMMEIIPMIDLSVAGDIFCVEGQSTDGSVEYLSETGIRVETQ